MNLAARYKINERFSVFGDVRNLFDEKYEDPNAYDGAPVSWSIGVRGAF